MNTIWRTVWQQQSIAVYRDDLEVDRIDADDIERVHLLYRGHGDLPGDIDSSVVELRGEAGYVLFEARTGFAGRVNFERQGYWKERGCVYWVPAAGAAFPWRFRLGGWRGDTAARACRRVPRAELEGCVLGWKLEGPQIWEQRKQRKIERNRPFGSESGWRAAA